MRLIALALVLFAPVAFAAEAQIEASGSLTVQWEPPVENEDGTPLTDLAGFRLYWGQTKGGPYPNSLPIDDAGRTSATVQFTGITQAETWWFFVATAIDESGNESRHSNEVMKKLTIEVEDTTPPGAPALSAEIEFTATGCVVVNNPSATCSISFE